MCGFLCVVTRKPLDQAVDVARFDKDVLRHRGPDSSGELTFPHAFVRHWRLSIVDLAETSSQPYGDGESWLIYNGEIYNYEAIATRLGLPATGDTPLLFGLCKLGIDQEELKRASGFYSFLFLSQNGLALSGARDPFGKKPLFYHVDDEAGIAVFASEEKAIIDCLGGQSRPGGQPIDFGAISQYLLYKQVFRGHTCFTKIKQLAPGARFHFDVRRWRFSVDRDWDAYYQMPAAGVFSITPGDDGESQGEKVEPLVYRRLRESLVLRVPRDVQASVALSGGIDSSLIARLAVETSSLSHISQFVTIGFDETSADESSRAAAIAAALSLSEKHSVVRFSEREMLTSLEWCVAQASAPLEHPHYLSYSVLCRYSSAYAKVLITGEGADELFMGYDHYLTPGKSFAFREYLLEEDERHFVSEASPGRAFDTVRRAAAVDSLRARALSSRALSREAELKTHLLTLLSRNDKMGMAHSVEIRAPFLDRHMMQLALALPESELVAAGSTKHVLKRMFANRFPAIALQERKIGFRVPFDEMFAAGRRRGDIRGHCEAAARALDRECGLRLVDLDTITPRLGWSLLNIGIFLDTQGYASSA
jgi:asparagine synthase (glutamine-hydrolysing)